jgi:hypothetical protein
MVFTSFPRSIANLVCPGPIRGLWECLAVRPGKVLPAVGAGIHCSTLPLSATGTERREGAARDAGRAPQPAMRAKAATWTKAQNASGWTAHARKAAAIASRSARDAYPYSTARSPIGEVRRRSA